MPHRQTIGGAAGAAALSGLIWAYTSSNTVFFKEGREEPLPLSVETGSDEKDASV